MHKIAIVGSRTITGRKAKEIIRDHMRKYNPKEVAIISGGAIGVDDVAEGYARHEGIKFIPYLAEWKKYGKAAGMIRNTTIAKECDSLLCIWDGESKGCIDTAKKASKMGKYVRTILVTK